MKHLLSISSLLGFTLLFFVVSASDVSAASCTSANLRYASSSNTIYVTGPVTCSLSEIKSLLPTVPLELVNATNKTWLLRANLKLEGGAHLPLKGTSVGGDVNQLRLLSSSSIVWIRAQWGTLDIINTSVTSWHPGINGPDTNYDNGRSYIHVRSYLEPDGVTPRESTMNVENSNIGYLGYAGAEAYGLTWKVSGSDPTRFDKVNVYGKLVNSKVHHNYFGMYSFGAFGLQLLNNEVYSNVVYGIDPHDDSDNLIISGNNVHHNGYHGIICSKRCDHLTITGNTSNNNGGNGIMLHRLTNESLVENNTTSFNADTGLSIFDSHNNIIRNNKSLNNKNGIRFSVGSSSNKIENNEFAFNTNYGVYMYKGSDVPTTGDGRPKLNTFTGNNIHHNGSYAIYIKESDNNTFTGNLLNANGNTVYQNDANNNVFN